MSAPQQLSLRQKQSLFARLLGELLVWIYAQGWEVTLADGSIDRVRKVEAAGKTFTGTDRVHMPGSLHYVRLAQDLNLFVDGRLVADGGHPAWQAIGARWKGQHELCAWGGDFASVDSNHVSLRHDGKA